MKFRVVLLLFLIALPAQASVVSGLVHSGTRAKPTATGFDAVKNAEVVLEGTDYKATTDRLGMFIFEGVPEGTYIVRVSKPGWQSETTTLKVDGGPGPVTTQVLLRRAGAVAQATPGTVYVAYAKRKSLELTPQHTVRGGVGLGADPLAIETNPPRSPDVPNSLKDNPISADPDSLMLLDAIAPEHSRIRDLKTHPLWLCFNRTGTVLYMSTVQILPHPTDQNKRVYRHYLEVTDTLLHKPLRRLPAHGLITDLRLSPRGDLLLVAVRSAQPGIHLIDTEQHLPVGFVPLSLLQQPDAVVMGNNGLLYVAVNGPEGTLGSVLALTLQGEIVAEAAVESLPTDIAMAPDGSSVYVVNSRSGSLSILDAGLSICRSVSVGVEPQKVAVSPDGSRIVVTNRGADSVTVLDGASGTVLATVDVGDEPLDVVFSQDGSQAYVTCKGDGTVYFLEGRSGRVVHVTNPQPRSSPFGIAVRP